MASLLRTRLIEDLRIRNYASRTIDVYVRCVALFAKYFRRSPVLRCSTNDGSGGFCFSVNVRGAGV